MTTNWKKNFNLKLYSRCMYLKFYVTHCSKIFRFKLYEQINNGLIDYENYIKCLLAWTFDLRIFSVFLSLGLIRGWVSGYHLKNAVGGGVGNSKKRNFQSCNYVNICLGNLSTHMVSIPFNHVLNTFRIFFLKSFYQ